MQKNLKIIIPIVLLILAIICGVSTYFLLQHFENKKDDTTVSAVESTTTHIPETTTTAKEDETTTEAQTTAEVITTIQETTTKDPYNFSSVNETVTAKETVNLRSLPSQDTDSQILATLNNGETATRTGINDSGWSRIEYNGTIYYAISNFLTTDLSYQPATTVDTTDGLQTVFTDCNDTVTAKDEVNLRSIPSVTNVDSVIIATIKNGDIVTRTGINTDVGWSRVTYNGQTLYCISSYLTTAN